MESDVAGRNTVLVIDDDESSRGFMADLLMIFGYNVISAADASDGYDLYYEKKPKAVFLDLIMPRISGYQFLSAFRYDIKVPVIAYSGWDNEHEIQNIIEAGADIFCKKTQDPELIIEDLNLILKFYSDAANNNIYFSKYIKIDFDNRIVIGRGCRQHLTHIHYGILDLLIRNQGKLLRNSVILNDIFGETHETDNYLIHSHINTIRNAIEPDRKNPIIIKTVPKAGYIFNHIA
jgi:two-component system, OmpR family, KDP operon response regulator KdpE